MAAKKRAPRKKSTAKKKKYTRITPYRVQKFLAKLRETGRVTTSSEYSDIARSSWYDRREKDPEFARAWDDAEAGYIDDGEAEALRRAIEGVEKTVPYLHHINADEKETRFYTINEKSDRLLELFLKSRHPLYKPTKSLEVGGPGGAPLMPPGEEPNFDNLTNEELEALVELQRKLHARDGDV